jgi:hypothetical protein
VSNRCRHKKILLAPSDILLSIVKEGPWLPISVKICGDSWK